MLDGLDDAYPRPQLRRARWMDLCGAWGFAYDDAESGLDHSWHERADVYTRTIVVPYPPESPASGIGDTSYHAVVWYRRTFRLPAQAADTRWLLHCGAVDYSAHVWVNGQLVATHEGGQTPFSADITAALRRDEDQAIVIRAVDRPTDLAQPRGKQDWEPRPHDIWYHRTTGIWQPVWLEPVAATHIAQVQWTPDLSRGLLGLSVAIRRHDATSLRVRVQLSLRGSPLADDTYTVLGAEMRRAIALDRPAMTMSSDRLLWSPEHPNLIDATLTLIAGDTAIDEAHSYTGLREVGVSAGRLTLNGRPYFLRMALDQGYWPQSHLAALDSQALRRDVELARALGFNGVRVHQKVEDPRFLYWCDRLGLLVWGEMANAYDFSPAAVGRLTREWMEVVRRDYSHPCIVAWVPINESWGVPNLAQDPAQRHFVQALYHLTKALDATRPTIGNDGWEHLVGDMIGVHDYAFDGATLRERYGSGEAVERTLREAQPGTRSILLPGHRKADQPVMLTECGGISYRPEPGTPWFGYGTVGDADAYLAKYRELIGAVLDCPTLAGFCYTQLTDTAQETNGLANEARTPKLNPAAVRAVNQRAPSAGPVD